MFTYTYQHRKTKKLLEMNVQFEAGNFMHLCGVDYYQIDNKGAVNFVLRLLNFTEL